MGFFKDCGCGCNGQKQQEKFVISLISALIFFVIASPETFIIVRKIFGSWVSSPNGCPTLGGLTLHTIVFMLIIWGLMNIRKESRKEEYEGEEEDEYEEEEEEEEEEELPPMSEMPTAEPYMSEIDFAPSPPSKKLASLDLMSDADTPAPVMKREKKGKSGKYTSCSCSDGKDIMIMK